MAFENPNIVATAVEATEFPDLARRYRVSAVPKTVVNADGEIMGALPPDAFIDQVIAQVSSLKSEVSENAPKT
jgi:predicted DsbA family dithiol-disulfide isomerase